MSNETKDYAERLEKILLDGPVIWGERFVHRDGVHSWTGFITMRSSDPLPLVWLEPIELQDACAVAECLHRVRADKIKAEYDGLRITHGMHHPAETMRLNFLSHFDAARALQALFCEMIGEAK